MTLLNASPQLEAVISQARRGRRSLAARRARLNEKAWFIVQAAAAAAVAWMLAAWVLHHPDPVFAPISAVVALGTSYGQRTRRVAESTIGVVLGVLAGDLFVALTGVGPWQIAFAVAAAMIVAVLLDASEMLLGQASVQALFVAAIAPSTDQLIYRWQDALIGGAVALAIAAIVPSTPLYRPREQAFRVAQTIADLLAETAQAVQNQDLDQAKAVLRNARQTEPLIRDLETAAGEGMDVIKSSPWRRGQSELVRRISVVIDPLDRALRSTRVLTRRGAAALADGEPVPQDYLDCLRELSAAVEVLAKALIDGNELAVARPALLSVAARTGQLQRTGLLSVEIILGQICSVVVDLLQVTGLEVDEATAAMPELRSAQIEQR